jgi:translation initiation factor 2B subunit (eIF-2B alpha/beta/delta family)
MTRLAAILLGLLAVGLAACGGDDAPSKEEYADQANDICRKAERSLENVGQNAESAEEIANAVNQVIEESRTAVDDLAGLERPEGEDGQTAERFVNATRTEIEEKGIPALEDLRDALRDEDQQAAQEAAQKLQGIDTEESNKAARDLGATACAEE